MTAGSAVSAAARAASSAGGQFLRLMTRAVAVRPASKPLHPEGAVVAGVLRRLGSGSPGTGVPWLDVSGQEHVIVRRSWAVGSGPTLPDVGGLAVRVALESGAHGDLLFASTGSGRLTRFLLVPRWSLRSKTLTTLLPYRTAAGPLVLSVRADDDLTFSLAWAVRTGPWHRFGELTLDRDAVGAEDLPVSFDPVRNVLPGLEVYDWVRRLREPAYAAARRSRDS
jgi:hypothetical protein